MWIPGKLVRKIIKWAYTRILIYFNKKRLIELTKVVNLMKLLMVQGTRRSRS